MNGTLVSWCGFRHREHCEALPVGSEPGKLAESDDGRYLYALLNGNSSLTRLDLTSGIAAGTYALQVNSPYGAPAPRDVAVMPGNHDTLAIDLGSSIGTGIFDITGSTGVFRTGITGIYTGSNIRFVNPNQLYSYDVDSSGAQFYRWNVAGTGLSALDASSINGMGGFSLDHGLVYGLGGGLADPSTSPAKQLGLYSSNSAVLGTQQFLQSQAVVPDATLNRVFFSAENSAGQAVPYLLAFDQQHFTPVIAAQLPLSGSGDMVRWGKDGLALLASNYPFGSTNTVVLLRGPIVLPQWSTLNAVPTLSALSSSTIAHGSGNQYLTVTGSKFVVGAAVSWNGVERTTTYIDATHLKFAVAASDVAAASSVTVTVTNPGTANSNSLALTVQ